MITTQTWQAKHDRAMHSPIAVEHRIVTLWETIGMLVIDHADDRVIAPGIADLIKGARVLLNTDLGRLDGGTLDARLMQYAEQIGYDLDTEGWTRP